MESFLPQKTSIRYYLRKIFSIKHNKFPLFLISEVRQNQKTAGFLSFYLFFIITERLDAPVNYSVVYHSVTTNTGFWQQVCVF